MTDLVFTTKHPTTPGYVAEVDPASGVTRWVILHTGSRRWDIVSVTASGERIRHGAPLTLREAKATVNRWHRMNLEASQAVTA